MPPISRSYRSQSTSPHAMHRRWIEQDMDMNDSDMMRAYDQAQYYAEQDACQTGIASDA